MPEEFGLGLDDVGEGGESGGEQASEEAQQRARDNNAKAKQVRTQIQQVQKQNTQFAVMLSILLQHVDDDAILGMIFHQLTQKQVPTPAIFAQFLPYLKTKTDITSYKPLYGALWTVMPKEMNVSSLVLWLKQVRGASKALQAIELDVYLAFAIAYLDRVGAVDMATLEPEKKQALLASVKKELG